MGQLEELEATWWRPPLRSLGAQTLLRYPETLAKPGGRRAGREAAGGADPRLPSAEIPVGEITSAP